MRGEVSSPRIFVSGESGGRAEGRYSCAMPSRFRRVPQRVRAIALAATLVAAARAVPAAEGTDLSGTHAWRDSRSGARIEPLAFDGPFVEERPAPGSPPSGPHLLGFAGGFAFYGGSYSSAWISENGWLSFENPAGDSAPSPGRIPDAATGPTAQVAPFWSNCRADDGAAGHVIRHGRVSSRDAYLVQYRGLDEGSGGPVEWDLALFGDGRIQVQYLAAATLAGATVGLESPDELDGIELAGGGLLADPTIAIEPGYAFEVLAPSTLAPSCSLVPERGCGSGPRTLPGNGPGLERYACAPGTWLATEELQSFIVTEPSEVRVELAGGAALGAFVLEDCHELRCLGGPVPPFDVPVALGSYVVAVDAPTPADEGAYTLTVTCTPLGTAVTCGTRLPSESNALAPSRWSSYPCAPAGRVLDGPEALYRIHLDTATNFRVGILGAAVDLDVLVLDASKGSLDPSDCIAWGDTQATLYDLPAGDYVLAVDGVAGATGAFTLDVPCIPTLDCGQVEGILDLGAARVQAISGNTSNDADSVSATSCRPGAFLRGGDELWQLELPTAGRVAVRQDAGTGQSVYLLAACDPSTCIGRFGDSACAQELPAGTYWLLVDQPEGQEGKYDLTVVFEEQFNRWQDCQDPMAPTIPGVPSAPALHLADHAFCISDPRHRNHPNGCGFAVYVETACGSELHFPMWDVEGGRVRVFDVLRGRYLDVTAISSGGFFTSGTSVRWQDPDCVDGGDPRWTNQVTDVSFRAPGDACGIFRLEFLPDHSGNVWDLYSNCSGIATQGFLLHDNFCDAVAAHRPLPELSLLAASATAPCPDITVTYTLRNDGCGAVSNFPVVLRDGTTDVHGDLVESLLPGETVTRTFTAVFPAVPTGAVALVADPLNVVLECSESLRPGCGSASGQDRRDLPGCAGACAVLARATASPSVVCAGGSASLDASPSSSSLCPGGILEYRLAGPGVPTPWQPSPLFTGLAPAVSTDYLLEARCADPALSSTCVDSELVRVEVDAPPSLAGARAFDLAACNLGLAVEWDPATFRGATGTGVYNVYRSTLSCADALLQPPVAAGLATTAWTDVDTAAGLTYHYVVEAENGSGPSPCAPRGPLHGGAVARVAVTDGSCAGILEVDTARPDLLPRVGGTLRAGGSRPGGVRRYGDAFVELEWGSDRALDLLSGEHFHALRSERPDGGFGPVVSEPPLLETAALTDAAADDTVGNAGTHVWHYLVFTADGCDNDNRAFPGA